MKLLSAKTNYEDVITSHKQAIIELTKEESDKLIDALLIINAYKKLAYDATNHNEANSDWTMTDFKVAPDKTWITITSGMCG